MHVLKHRSATVLAVVLVVLGGASLYGRLGAVSAGRTKAAPAAAPAHRIPLATRSGAQWLAVQSAPFPTAPQEQVSALEPAQWRLRDASRLQGESAALHEVRLRVRSTILQYFAWAGLDEQQQMRFLSALADAQKNYEIAQDAVIQSEWEREEGGMEERLALDLMYEEEEQAKQAIGSELEREMSVFLSADQLGRFRSLVKTSDFVFLLYRNRLLESVAPEVVR
jgi:hypothetical protein